MSEPLTEQDVNEIVAKPLGDPPGRAQLKHVCGAQGFSRMHGDYCEGCGDSTAAPGREEGAK